MNPHINALEDWFRHPAGLSGNNRVPAQKMFNVAEIRHCLKVQRHTLTNNRVYTRAFSTWGYSSLNQFFTYYWIDGPQMRKCIDFPVALFLLVTIGKMRKYQALNLLLEYRAGRIVNFSAGFKDFRSSKFMDFCPILSRTQERTHHSASVEESLKVKELLDEYLPVTVQTRQRQRQTSGFFSQYLASAP